ncbi:MAG: hypothetical protein SPK52_01020 [Synergistales bacterium]|jgi:hypothetical protein|nr:hypothetical protein [Bacteroidales bacterium]MDY6434780.1 hypothetical protein [Synergistales bacterium]MDY6381659.1 hypothetical protein [Bacteroidales bacterium]MDY6393516.1 hypothetical protein [Bacteroidales bacterium]MDY6395436.1 hypothetical protein [Bacteroidales bacterium]
MKKIDTKIIELNKPVEAVFYALSDFSNLRALPEANEKIKNFQCSYDTLSFEVDANGMANVEVELKITDRKPFEYITIMNQKEIMGGFSFAMNFIFTKVNDYSCTMQGKCNVEGNAMVLMMFKKQIENGLNTLMDGIKKSVDGIN